jgi:hypothetical protein
MIPCSLVRRGDIRPRFARRSAIGSKCSEPVLPRTIPFKRCAGPRGEESLLTDLSAERGGLALSQIGSVTSPPARPVAARTTLPGGAARTKLMLEGPILPTLLRLSAPNVLNFLAFVGMITFDGFFLGRLGSPVRRWHFRSSCSSCRRPTAAWGTVCRPQ